RSAQRQHDPAVPSVSRLSRRDSAGFCISTARLDVECRPCLQPGYYPNPPATRHLGPGISEKLTGRLRSALPCATMLGILRPSSCRLRTEKRKPAAAASSREGACLVARKRKLPDGMVTRSGRKGYYADFRIGGRRVQRKLSTDFDAAKSILFDL